MLGSITSKVCTVQGSYWFWEAVIESLKPLIRLSFWGTVKTNITTVHDPTTLSCYHVMSLICLIYLFVCITTDFSLFHNVLLQGKIAANIISCVIEIWKNSLQFLKLPQHMQWVYCKVGHFQPNRIHGWRPKRKLTTTLGRFTAAVSNCGEGIPNVNTIERYLQAGVRVLKQETVFQLHWDSPLRLTPAHTEIHNMSACLFVRILYIRI